MFILHKNIPSLRKTTTSDSAEQRTRFVFKSPYKIKVKFHSPSMNVCFSSVESASCKRSVQERFQNLDFRASFMEQRAPSHSDVRCGGVCLPWQNEAPRTGNEVAVFRGNSDWLLVHLDCANVCGTSNDDPQTSNDPQIGPQVIPWKMEKWNGL